MKIAHFSGFPAIRGAFIFINKEAPNGALFLLARASARRPGLKRGGKA